MYKLKMSPNEIRSQIQIKPKEWINLETTNCYAYALGLDINENDICEYAYQPGSISSKVANLIIHFNYFLYSVLIKNIEKDFETLGISYKEIEPDDEIQDDEWKIALFVEFYDKYFMDDLISDFHFLRANSNGVWTHKHGYCNSPKKKDDSNKIITDLKECDLTLYEYRKCYALRLNNQ